MRDTIITTTTLYVPLNFCRTKVETKLTNNLKINNTKVMFSKLKETCFQRLKVLSDYLAARCF